MPTRKYDLFAIDLDGTLLNSRGEVSPRNLAAIHSAREAGYRIVVCTGRGLKECRGYLDVIAQTDAVVVAGGSIIADPATSRTIHRFSMDEDLVTQSVACLHQQGHAAMVLKDPAGVGFDYLVVRGEKQHKLDPIMDWWFDLMGVEVRYIDHMHEDAHPQHSVRIGALGISTGIAAVAERLKAIIGERGVMHHFPAVVGPDHVARLGPGEKFHILELFAAAGNKWSAVDWLAARDGIDPRRIVAIGDEINDVSMITHAGLGVAMGNAIHQVRDVADKVTLGHNEDGFAIAVERVISGAW